MKILLIFIVFLISTLSIFSSQLVVNNKIYRGTILFFLTLSLGVVFGWSSYDDFSDRITYEAFFISYSNLSLVTALDVSPMDKGYTLIQWVISKLVQSPSLFFLIVFIIYFLTITISFKKIFSSKYYLFALIGFIFTPMFINMGGNIIRTGLAFGFLLLGITSVYYKKKIHSLLYLFVSIFFHASILPLAIIFIFIDINKIKFKVFYWTWLISAIIFLTNIQTLLFPFLLSINKLNTYSQSTAYESYGNSSLRIDFFVFNTFLILILILINKYQFKFKNSMFNFLVKTAFISASVFHIIGFIAFSDRVAMFVWLFFIISLLLSVVELNKRKPIILPLYLIINVIYSIITKSYLFFY